MSLLKVENVTAGYLPGVDILQGVNLSVDQGDIVSIIGPNGAGKSTLAKTIFGLVAPRQGDIIFEGQSIAGLKPSQVVSRGLCYVPQVNNVFANLTIHENLEMGCYLLKSGKRQRIQQIYELFPDLAGKKNQKAGNLSGGQRQMLAMGRALTLDPRLLVLDEPSAGLSPQLVDVVFDKIQDVNEAGCSILMVEQNAHRALELSDTGYVLDMGKDAITGPGPELLDDPQVIELYLGTLHDAQD